MELEDVEPKLLSIEEVRHYFRIYNEAGYIFEGSPLMEIFQHILSLSRLFNLTLSIKLKPKQKHQSPSARRQSGAR